MLLNWGPGRNGSWPVLSTRLATIGFDTQSLSHPHSELHLVPPCARDSAQGHRKGFKQRAELAQGLVSRRMLPPSGFAPSGPAQAPQALPGKAWNRLLARGPGMQSAEAAPCPNQFEPAVGRRQASPLELPLAPKLGSDLKPGLEVPAAGVGTQQGLGMNACGRVGSEDGSGAVRWNGGACPASAQCGDSPEPGAGSQPTPLQFCIFWLHLQGRSCCYLLFKVLLAQSSTHRSEPCGDARQ